MNAAYIRLLYAFSVIIPVFTGSIIVDSNRRLSKILRSAGFIVVPSLFYGLSLVRLLDFQLLLTVVAGLTALAISMHAEGYYRYMYGISRYYQVAVDTCLALLILLFSSILFVELLVYWFLVDLVVVLVALTLEYGPENLPIVATYLVMCLAPSDIAVLTMFSILALEVGVEQALMTSLAVDKPLVTLNPITSILITFGLTTKLGQFPLHSWLPRVHGEAPTHVSAILSGLIIKLGIYGLLIVSRMFILDPIAYYIALAQSVVTIIYGSLGAVIQSNVKRLLAYSSMAYGGILVVLFVNYTLWSIDILYPALLMVLAFHVITKALAFINVAFVYQVANTYDIYRLGHLYYISREMSFFAFTAFLNLLGTPPSMGFIVKLVLIATALMVVKYGLHALIILIAFTVFAVFSIAYSAKFMNMYISKIPRIAPRLIPIPREILYSEALLSITTVLIPIPFITYILFLNAVLTTALVPVVVVYTVLLVTYLYVFKREVFTKSPFREDIKYWLSGVET